MVYEGDSESYNDNDSPLHGNYFPSLYGISLYVSFKSQGTLNVNNSLKKNPHGLGLSWKNKIVIF